MNRPTAPLGVVFTGCSVLLAAAVASLPLPAFAQAAAPAPAAAPAGPTTLPVSPLPGEVKSSFNAATHSQLVNDYVAACVKNLTSTNPGAQSRGRDDLVAGSSMVGAPAPAFIEAYLAALNKGLDPIISDPKAPLRTRIQAGIVIARTSAKAADPQVGPQFAKQLEGSTLKLLNDPSDIVVLWGMKSAANLVPALAKANQQSPLLKDAIAKAVAKHSNFAPIAQEAYSGLTLNYPIMSAPVTIAPAVIPQLLDVLKSRVDAYRGPGLPAEPRSEQNPATFLTLEAVWKQETPEQRKQVVQIVSDMVHYAAQQYAHAVTRPEKEGLANAMQHGAKSIQVALNPAGDSPLAAAINQLSKFNINVNTPQDATNAANAFVTALAPQGVKPAGAIQPPAATGSATATAAAPVAGAPANNNAAPAASTAQPTPAPANPAPATNPPANPAAAPANAPR